MAHIHSVYDTDLHFIIDPITRAITNQGTKSKVIQYDHNSERITFEMPRFVDGHDMTLCDKVEIHYANGHNKDIYTVDDKALSPATDDVLIFSWLLSRNATNYVGALRFSIRFACLTGEEIDYDWHTGVCSSIVVEEGINNTEAMIEENPDLLEAWKNSVDERIDETNAILETLVEGA